MPRHIRSPRGRLVAIVAPAAAAGLLAVTGLPGQVAGLAMGMAASPATGGQFTVQCSYSHTLKDDTIVFPAQPGASHAHDFYGNVGTSATSTYASMVSAATTCTTPDDTAAYWQPVLVVDGRPVAANAERAYYSNETKGPIQAFPAGLRMIAGNSHATGPQPTSVFYWGCAHDEDAGQLTSPPQCTDQLRAHITFPNCWDGQNLDSADHRSHMAYSSGGRCPADHPVALPRLIIAVGWNATPAPSSVTLSSGPAYTMHADFLNTWHQSALESLVSSCLAAHVNCGEITAPVTSGAAPAPVAPARTPSPAPAPAAAAVPRARTGPDRVTALPAAVTAANASPATVTEGPVTVGGGPLLSPEPPWLPRAATR